MENKNNKSPDKKSKIVLGVIIGLLLVIIGILIYFLSKPESTSKYEIDKIDVETNLIDDKEEVLVENINEITDKEDIVVKDRKEMYKLLKERQRAAGDWDANDTVEEYDDEGNVLDEESQKKFADESAETFAPNMENIFEDYAITIKELEKEQKDGWMTDFEMNYLQEDALSIAKSGISAISNITITPNTKTPLIEKRNCYGDNSIMWVFDVVNNETGEKDDGIAVNAETGDPYGYTKEFGVIIPFRYYQYSKQYLLDEMEYDPETNRQNVSPYDKVKLWEKIGNLVNLSNYPENSVKVVLIDGQEYYKWSNTKDDTYLLFDYETGQQID